MAASALPEGRRGWLLLCPRRFTLLNKGSQAFRSFFAARGLRENSCRMFDQAGRVLESRAAQKLFCFSNRAGCTGQDVLKGVRKRRLKLRAARADVMNKSYPKGFVRA